MVKSNASVEKRADLPTRSNSGTKNNRKTTSRTFILPSLLCLSTMTKDQFVCDHYLNGMRIETRKDLSAEYTTDQHNRYCNKIIDLIKTALLLWLLAVGAS